MTQGKRRTLKAWRAEKKLTPEALWRAGAGISPDVIRRWEQSGEPPAEARGHGIAVAQALGVPVDLLDFGASRRGFTEAGYQFVLAARGRDATGWEAIVEDWKGPDPWSSAVAMRANIGPRSNGPVKAAALDALEAELRELIRTNPPDSGQGFE
jgi:hypothetical protein